MHFHRQKAIHTQNKHAILVSYRRAKIVGDTFNTSETQKWAGSGIFLGHMLVSVVGLVVCISRSVVEVVVEYRSHSEGVGVTLESA